MNAQADFYILNPKDSQNYLTFTCKLAHKAYKAHSQLRIYTASTAETQELDQLLWAVSAESFIPHHLASNETNLLIIGEENSIPKPIIVRLQLKPITAAWQRLLQIVKNDPSSLEQARDLFRHYKENNITINTHKM